MAESESIPFFQLDQGVAPTRAKPGERLERPKHHRKPPEQLELREANAALSELQSEWGVRVRLDDEGEPYCEWRPAWLPPSTVETVMTRYRDEIHHLGQWDEQKARDLIQQATEVLRSRDVDPDPHNAFTNTFERCIEQGVQMLDFREWIRVYIWNRTFQARKELTTDESSNE